VLGLIFRRALGRWVGGRDGKCGLKVLEVLMHVWGMVRREGIGGIVVVLRKLQLRHDVVPLFERPLLPHF
jgi:hypothetical protein